MQQPPAVSPPVTEPPVSKTLVVVLNILGVLATLVGGAIIGIAAADSESAGVTASYLVTGPVAFFWGAGIGSLLGRFALKSNPGLGKAAPWGCGCGCGLVLGLGLVVFMVAIFPSL